MQLTLAEALAITDEARVVTLAKEPYSIVHTNRAWSELTGYRFTEVVGKSCALLQGPATSAASLKQLNESIRAKRRVKTQLVNYTKAGTPILVSIECSPVVGGSHYYATLSGAPITDGSVAPRAAIAPVRPRADEVGLVPVSYIEHCRAKRPRRSTEHVRLADVLANQTDPIVLCAKEYPHVITHPNQPWLEMCGYTLEEVEGHTNKILCGPETDPDVLEQLNACVARRETSVQTVVNYKKGGEKFLNQARDAPRPTATRSRATTAPALARPSPPTPTRPRAARVRR